MKYSISLIQQASNEIASGYVQPSPCNSNGSSCNICEYSDVCGFEGKERKFGKVVLRRSDKADNEQVAE